MSDENTQHEAFISMAEYVSALDRICATAQKILVVFEKDFTNTGFNSSERINVLQAFLLANPKNELKLLAHDTRPFTQHCPRLMDLIRQFGHAASIYQTPRHLHHLTEPFAVADMIAYARRFHFDHSRGMLALNDASNARLYKSRFDEMWQASQPSPWTASFVL